MKESMFSKKRSDGKILCNLCPHNCVIADGSIGVCGVRKNENGRLISLVYGRLCSVNIDPIEKKPLFHFAPGTSCLSICTVGCNLSCSFCQNSDISHPQNNKVFGEEITPEKVIEITKHHGMPGIAYTYTEPTIAWEYYIEIMKLARKEGLYNVWVSNGYINPEPAKKIAKYIDAINVDLKGDLKFYNKLCGIPNENPIHKALKIYKKSGVWIEITTLIIPGHNDKPEQINSLMKWVKDNLSQDTPIHISRFFPHYKMQNIEPTPEQTLQKAYQIAKEIGLRYAYIGNIASNEWQHTKCPKCNSVVIKRSGFSATEIKTKCDKCKTEIPIAGKKWLNA